MQKSDARLDHLDLRDLRLLAHVLDSRSVTRTAEALGLSQPAASRALDRLRRVLRDRLVVRTSQGGALTPYAQTLPAKVEVAMTALGDVFRPAVFEPKTAVGTVRLASTDYGAAIVAAPLLAALAREAPGLGVRVASFGADTFDDLARGRLDLALYADAALPPDFHRRDLFREGYACLVREAHPGLSRRGDVVRRFGDFPRAVMLFPDGRRLLADDVLTSLLGAPAAPHAFATPYSFSAPLAVATSDLVLCVPARAARIMARTSGLKVVEVPSAKGFTYRLVWHERTHLDPRLTWVRRCLTRLSFEAP